MHMTKRNDSGQALIEVAFSIGIFLLLVMGTIEFGNLFNTKVHPAKCSSAGRTVCHHRAMHRRCGYVH